MAPTEEPLTSLCFLINFLGKEKHMGKEGDTWKLATLKIEIQREIFLTLMDNLGGNA